MNLRSKSWLAVFALLPASAFGAHPIDELAYLTALPEKAGSLGFNVTECPIALASPTDFRAPRFPFSAEIDLTKVLALGAMQRGMAGQVWEWRSYRVLGSEATCIELVRPIQELLTRERAAILTMVMNNVRPDGSVNREELLPWEVPEWFDDMPTVEESYGKQTDTEPSSDGPPIDAAD